MYTLSKSLSDEMISIVHTFKTLLFIRLDNAGPDELTPNEVIDLIAFFCTRLKVNDNL